MILPLTSCNFFLTSLLSVSISKISPAPENSSSSLAAKNTEALAVRSLIFVSSPASSNWSICCPNRPATESTSFRNLSWKRLISSPSGLITVFLLSVINSFKSVRAFAIPEKSNNSSSSCRMYSCLASRRMTSSGMRQTISSWKATSSGTLLNERSGSSLLKIIPSSERQRERATYTCPWVKAARASMITLSKVSPWLLWMVNAQASFRGYWVKVPSTRSWISLVFSSME